MNADKVGAVMRSPFRFAKHGNSGIDVSDLLPYLARVVDKLTVVRSMYTEHINHEPAIWMMNTGRTIPGRPSAGSWVVYGLGTENQNLPGLRRPGRSQGRARRDPELVGRLASSALPGDAVPRGREPGPEPEAEPNLDVGGAVAPPGLLSALAEDHRRSHPGESELAARIAATSLPPGCRSRPATPWTSAKSPTPPARPTALTTRSPPPTAGDA